MIRPSRSARNVSWLDVDDIRDCGAVSAVRDLVAATACVLLMDATRRGCSVASVQLARVVLAVIDHSYDHTKERWQGGRTERAPGF